MKVTFKGKEVQLIGMPPKVGDEMPNFTVLDKNKQEVTKDNLLGKNTLISVVPDINTSVCSIQTKTFNKTMDQFPDCPFSCIINNRSRISLFFTSNYGYVNTFSPFN